MKKIFTFCVSLLMGCVALNAQTFAFVDSDGKVIENNSTVTMPQNYEIDMNEGNVFVSLKGVSIKNISSASAKFDMTYEVVELPVGSSFQACCLGACHGAMTSVGETDSYLNNESNAGSTSDLFGTEWLTGGKGTEYEDAFGKYFDKPIVDYGASGTCKIKISVMPSGTKVPDSEIFVNFLGYGGDTGISGVGVGKDNAVVGYYTVGGAKLNAPQKGLNIVKYADGTTKKIIKK